MSTALYNDEIFSELDGKGYLVISSFLNNTEINTFLNDFQNKSSKDITNHNYIVYEAKREIIDFIKEKFAQLIDNIRNNTNIRVSYNGFHIGYYFASQEVSFGWHQDLESYYATQNHYDYINFFIPLSKPEKSKGNLSMIPWDKLKEKCPDEYEELILSGACLFYTFENKTIIVKDEGKVAELPFNIGELAVTPELDAGDLLLFRGDIIHQTQDTETDRVAISIRFINPETKINRNTLLTGGKLKTKVMLNNWNDFGPMIKVFQNRHVKEMSWEELNNCTSDFRSSNYNNKTLGRINKPLLWLQKLIHGDLKASIIAWRNYSKAQTLVKQEEKLRKI